MKGKNADLVNVFIGHGAQTSSQQLLFHRAVLDDQVCSKLCRNSDKKIFNVILTIWIGSNCGITYRSHRY